LLTYSTSALTEDDTDDGSTFDLYAIDIGNGSKTLLTASVAGGIEGESSVAFWSPDGGTLVIRSGSTLTEDDTNESSDDLFTYNAATGEKVLLVPMGRGDFVYDAATGLPRWSSDGQTIEIITDESVTPDDIDNGGVDIYSINVGNGDKSLIDLGLDPGSMRSFWAEGGPEATIIGVQTLLALDYYLLI
jgi:Tol biopolymer transport system component